MTVLQPLPPPRTPGNLLRAPILSRGDLSISCSSLNVGWTLEPKPRLLVDHLPLEQETNLQCKQTSCTLSYLVILRFWVKEWSALVPAPLSKERILACDVAQPPALTSTSQAVQSPLDGYRL